MGWKILSVLWFALGIVTILPAMASPLMMDAPGLESSLPTIVLMAMTLGLPHKFQDADSAKFLIQRPSRLCYTAALGGEIWLVS